MPDVLFTLISVAFGAILGGGITWFVNRDTIKFSRKSEIANTIKDRFIDDLERILNLESNKNDEAGRIVRDNINATNSLIRKLFFYIGKSKRKKITEHYNEYKNPYKASPTEIDPLNAFPSDEDITYPDTYIFKQVPNARKRAMEYLEKLINEFKRI